MWSHPSVLKGLYTLKELAKFLGSSPSNDYERHWRACKGTIEYILSLILQDLPLKVEDVDFDRRVFGMSIQEHDHVDDILAILLGADPSFAQPKKSLLTSSGVGDRVVVKSYSLSGNSNSIKQGSIEFYGHSSLNKINKSRGSQILQDLTNIHLTSSCSPSELGVCNP
ncbi:hypothetical protein VNO77_02106 [Canavalia gladiata]|uniref:Uncharacterized protein n=1 Tax=Canavalia gladiata TaxID=3824 RepID=A0AAN9MYS8_CANGL